MDSLPVQNNNANMSWILVPIYQVNKPTDCAKENQLNFEMETVITKRKEKVEEIVAK